MAIKTLSRNALYLILCASAFGHSARAKDRVDGCLQRNGQLDAASNSSKHVYQTEFPGVTWDEHNWLLSTTHLQQGAFQSRGSIANGYLGINVASVGPFFELDTASAGDLTNGWPLFSRRQTFATIAGFFNSQQSTNGTNFPWLSQYGYDSVISGIPHWSGLILDLGGLDYLDARVDNTTISHFRSTYDFQAGLLSWSYKWTPAKQDSGSFQIKYRLFANKLRINEAVVDMEIIPSQDGDAVIANVLDGAAAVRTDFAESGEDNGAIFSAVRPSGISNVTAYVFANVTGSGGIDLSSRKLVQGANYTHANDSSVTQTFPIKFSAGQTVRITKYVGVASTDAFADPKTAAKNAVTSAMEAGYMGSLKSHVTEWASVMPEDSVDRFSYPENGTLLQDEYIIGSAIIAVTNTYYLLQNTVGKNAIKAVKDAPVNVDSISVGGLTSDSYAGQVFWDADLWMQPGLAASHPEAAQRVTNYRVEKYGQAKANIETSFASSQNKTRFSSSAAVYPWTSGRTGNCTATGPCWDYEYHINGDIGLSFINQWVTSGDTQFFKDNLFPIYDSVAQLYADLLKPNGSSWTLTNMTDPDEFANNIDAGGFTMALIGETLVHANQFRQQFGLPQNETWTDMASNVLKIRENGITLEFTTMNGSAPVKQADVILVTYPLSYNTNYSDQDALNDLDYYANKQSPDGPAMTYAFFSIVANEISPSGCSAYTYAQYAYKPYTRPPFYQLSEQLIDNSTTNGGTHPAYPFLTGHGGANQVVLFGYLGLRLLPDEFLHVDPNLPPQIPYIKYRTFYWRGWPISAWSNYTHTTISRAKNTVSLAGADKTYANKTIEVHSGPLEDFTIFSLPLNGSIVIPNRQLGSNATSAGNLVQCRPAESSTDYVPGQFPIAAVDGATSTKWQPILADKLSSVTVLFSEDQIGSLVSGFQFDWAQAPPMNATVIFHNNSLRDPVHSFLAKEDAYEFSIVTSLTNISQSDPFNIETDNPNMIAIPTGNTTNVTLSTPVPATRFATLLIIGNQALDQTDIEAKNGTGATVAEWVIIGKEKLSETSSSQPSSARRMKPRDAGRFERLQNSVRK